MKDSSVAVRVKEVSKRYRSAKQMSLDRVSLSIPFGEVYGLLGPNGAGKTTLIRLISGVSLPTRGDIEVCGLSVTKDTVNAKKQIAVVTQGVSLNRTLSVQANVEFFLRFHGWKPPAARSRAKTVLERLNLDIHSRKNAAQLSGGLRRRVQLAQALACEAKVLILDEPTTGLDPQSRLDVWAIVAQLQREHGTTVILSTQVMEEAERLCTFVCLMSQGRIARAASVTEMKALAGPAMVQISLHDTLPASAEQSISSLPNVRSAQIRGNNLYVYTFETSSVTVELLDYLGRTGVRASTVVFESPSLENAYLALVAEGGTNAT